MARTSLQDVRSLPDPLQQYNWDLFIPIMPGTPNSRAFTFKAMTTSIPGALIEKVEVPLHGVQVNYAGRANYSHSLPITLLETRDVGTRDMLRRWQRTARDWITNTGTYKDVYSTTVEMVLYDDLPTEIKRIKLIGCFVESLDDASVDGSASAAVNISCTLSYDFLEEDS
jgi:hypothetical protein